MIPITRLAERSLALTIAAFILLTPPVILVFNVPATLFGIPILHIYAFATWLAAIVVGGRIAVRLGAPDGEAPPPGGDGA